MFGEEYAPIYPKVKSWMTNMIRDEEIDNLLRMNLDEMKLYLKTKVKKVDINTDEVDKIEGLLKQEAYHFLQSGKRFLSGKTRDFIDAWTNYFEIENIKIVARSIVYKKNISYLYQLSPINKIQYDFMKDIRTLDELQDFLSGTEYYRLAQDSLPRVKEENSTFYLEMNLDNYYAMNLKKKSASMSFQDKKEVKELFFYTLEMERIVWIYRAKFNYELNREEILSLIPNVFNLLTQARYIALIDSENKETFIGNLKSFGLLKEVKEGLSLETLVELTKKDRAKKHMSGIPFRIGILLSFVLLHQINIKNIIILLESKRVNLSTEEISSLLIM